MTVGIRGPYGNWFPLDDLKGKNLLFVGGGIGLAPLRSLIQYCIDNRKDYKDFTILYGARTSADMCYKDEIEEWRKDPSLKVILTIDNPEDNWKENVGVVPKILEEVVKPVIENTKVITCGPPIMIKYTIQSLLKLGFADQGHHHHPGDEDAVRPRKMRPVQYRVRPMFAKTDRCLPMSS